jgi:hypothetical protein
MFNKVLLKPANKTPTRSSEPEREHSVNSQKDSSENAAQTVRKRKYKMASVSHVVFSKMLFSPSY